MRHSSQRGATRFELLVVIGAILALSALVVGLRMGTSEGEDETAATTARRIVTAVSDWKREHHEVGCPTLSQLIVDEHWEREERADDPWGRRFLIHCSTEEVNVRSAGPDGRFETSDDVAMSSPWAS